MLKFNTSKLIFVEADTLLDAVKHCGYTQAHLRRSMPVQWLFKAEATKLRLAALKKEKDAAAQLAKALKERLSDLPDAEIKRRSEFAHNRLVARLAA